MNDTQTMTTAHWKDTLGREYQVFLDLEHIRLKGDGTTIDLPRDRWHLDLYIARYAAGFLVRIETFAQSLQFILSESQAVSLLSLIAPPTQEAQSPASATTGTDRDAVPTVDRGLLWPKVSPLAVWSLICSSLTFIPVAGWLPALVTLVLLVLHRVYVHHTPEKSHSRTMCVAAFAFLLVGSAVSVLATWSFRAHGTDLEGTSLFVAAAPAPEQNWGMIISGILVVLLSLSVHECAHAITAWWLGDGLAKSLGRVTLNPLAHIDPVGTVLLPIILAVSKSPVFFGYAKPVPVYVETLPRYRRAHILISVAGPGSNLLLAAASMMTLLGAVCALRLAVPAATLSHLASFSLAMPVVASGFPLASYFGLACTLLKLSFVVNVALAFFNLIPIPPLDGSWVLEHLFPRMLGPFYSAIRPYGFLIFVLALYGDVLDSLRVPVDYVLAAGLALLAATTGW
jgi:Zn-dependent protease